MVWLSFLVINVKMALEHSLSFNIEWSPQFSVHVCEHANVPLTNVTILLIDCIKITWGISIEVDLDYLLLNL